MVRYTHPINIRLSEDAYKRLYAKATSEGMLVSEFVRDLIKRSTKKMPKKAKNG